MIEIRDLKLAYENLEVLKGISLTIEDRDIYGLIGQSGAGKSTLLSCINGLHTYDEGSLKVDGKEVKGFSKKIELRKFRRNIGMIFQHFSLIERETVYKNIAIPLECWHYSRQDINRRVQELIQLVGLEEKIHEKAKNLSGGQKQRVAIARALALNSKILLCDEATSALDPKITQDILKLLRKINETLGVTIVVVTHEMAVIRQICNKVAVLENGRIAACGRVEDVLLHTPEVFNNFTGENLGSILPASGKNLRIIYAEDSDPSEIFHKMRQLDAPYRVVYGSMDKYRDQILGSIFLNVREEDLATFTDFMQQNHIKIEVL